MGDTAQVKPNNFCWADLNTTEQQGAKAFFTDLLGWETQDLPVEEGVVYTMAFVDGKDVAAISPMPPDRQGMPPHWNSYVLVESADDVAGKAKDLGANVIVPPFDVMDQGRMAVLQDPTGAFIALWEGRAHFGASLFNEPGAMCWNELLTGDLGAAKSFYTALFGWTAQDMPDAGGPPYVLFSQDESPVAGMMQIAPEMGEVPPNWGLYFTVTDIQAAVSKVKELGGQVVVGPQDTPFGPFIGLTDPQGGFVSVIQLTDPSA